MTEPTRRHHLPFALFVLALSCVGILGGCTKKNEAFCCVTAEDCVRLKLAPDDLRPCDDGLVCVQNFCLPPSCEASACEAAAPVCDLATDLCTGCSDSGQCEAFPDRPACDASTGACVECASPADCDAAEPVCDRNACRTCTRDAECPSGACADDGTCVPEASVVYLDPQGQDSPPCTRARPCKIPGFGVLQTNTTRQHIVMAPGAYASPGFIPITAQATTAQQVTIHGGGAIVTGGSSDGLVIINIPATIRDLELVNSTVGDGGVIYIGATTTLERIRVRGHKGLLVGAQLTMRDAVIEAADRAIVSNGALTIDRATIRGGVVGIEAPGGSVDISNLLLYGTSGIGIDLTNTVGSIKFSTIANAGHGGSTTPSIRCVGLASVQATIVWTPVNTVQSGIEGCLVSTSIAGPVSVPGASNADPLFVNAAAGDYHLNGGSPARDMVNAGPMTDFEGDPRPRGARFDIGADETP